MSCTSIAMYYNAYIYRNQAAVAALMKVRADLQQGLLQSAIMLVISLSIP